ncbi:MAG: hypothetical protein ACK5XN_04655, partial [Bacteroidota bacterium]
MSKKKGEPPISDNNGDTILLNVSEKSTSVSVKKPGKQPGEEAAKKETSKTRVGKHAIDNILKPRDKSEYQQLKLWETTQEKIDSFNTAKLVNKNGAGIRLSPGETRLILILCDILNEKSPNSTNYKQPDYLSGNKEPDKVDLPTNEGKVIQLSGAKFSTNLHELTKRYSGEDRPGGKQQQIVLDMLKGLSEDPEKRCLLRWERQSEAKRKGEAVIRTESIEHYSPIVRLYKAETTDTSIATGEVISRQTEIIVTLHPIFTDQVPSKYVELPRQLTALMIEAAGQKNISEISQKFILLLLRATGFRLPEVEGRPGIRAYTIAKQNVIEQIAQGYIPPDRSRRYYVEQ